MFLPLWEIKFLTEYNIIILRCEVFDEAQTLLYFKKKSPWTKYWPKFVTRQVAKDSIGYNQLST